MERTGAPAPHLRGARGRSILLASALLATPLLHALCFSCGVQPGVPRAPPRSLAGHGAGITSGSRGSDHAGGAPGFAARKGPLSAQATAAAEQADTKATPSTWERLSVWFYILMWYALSIAYNIYFKKSLIAYPFPWACALFQIAFGWLVFGPLWLLGVRKAPSLTRKEALTLLPSAVGNLVLHVGAVIAFFGGAVSFVHIVKASEPVVSSLLNYLFIGEVLAWPVYASLLPIIGGVALASAKEMSFTWLGFSAAMLSNFGSAGRAVYSKKIMGSAKIGKNMDSANTFSVMTIMGTVLLLPLAFHFEPPAAMWKGFCAAYAAHGRTFLWHMFASGFMYYMYNELAFLALGKLDPVSHAVVNTMKRVAIIVAAIVVFGTKVTPLGAIGSGVAVLGTLLYSLAKNKYKN